MTTMKWSDGPDYPFAPSKWVIFISNLTFIGKFPGLELDPITGKLIHKKFWATIHCLSKTSHEPERISGRLIQSSISIIFGHPKIDHAHDQTRGGSINFATKSIWKRIYLCDGLCRNLPHIRAVLYSLFSLRKSDHIKNKFYHILNL